MLNLISQNEKFTRIFDIMPHATSMGELKCIIYLMQHSTHDYEFVQMTEWDFATGRKLPNGEKADNGTGLSHEAVHHGLKRAIEHGFIECKITKKPYDIIIAKSYRIKES
jgi:hypothetical protein